MYQLKCKICKKKFNSSYLKGRVYCGMKCRDISRKDVSLIELKCDNCGKYFKRKKSRPKHNEKFCSKNCSASFYRKDTILTNEVREKISQSLKGKIPQNIDLFIRKGNKFRFTSENRKGKTPTLGMKFGIETRLKKSERMRGERHWNWQGGINSINDTIRKSIEYKLWREAVYKRDNYTCLDCGKNGIKLNAHHIKPFSLYPELRFAIDNGKTLCEKCHNKTKIYLRSPIVNCQKLLENNNTK